MLKITPEPGAYGGIWCHVDLGPSFGSQENRDLEVLHVRERFGSHILACNLQLCYGFRCPEKDIFIHWKPFKIDELEVFHIEY